MKVRKTLLAAIGLAFAAGAAQADIKVGVVLSATGPAASLGIPEKNTIALLPTTIGSEKVQYIVLDDASDTTTAVKNARKLVAEDKVDVIVGSTTSPASLAMVDVAAETQTPMISMAASARIVAPMDDKKRWIFKTPQNDQQMATAIIEHMGANNVRRSPSSASPTPTARAGTSSSRSWPKPRASRSSPTSASTPPTPRSPARRSS